ncbi:MAG: Bacterial sugar transferase [uncultured bacterium]|nr:MAG: Bacterial sugar transferase [uncultured bacterium]
MLNCNKRYCYQWAKRVFDIIFSLILLILFIPLLLFLSIAIKLNSHGSILYRGSRVGLHGKQFKILKFRTMVENAESIGGPSTALNDPRLTKIGRFLRKYKLDELPQLVNILIGDMSFVGPRPQVQKYTDLYTSEEQIILSVKPGLTDYASLRFINLDQLLGDDKVDEKYMREVEPEKNKLRIEYVKKRAFCSDLKIIFLTILMTLKIKQKWNTQD